MVEAFYVQGQNVDFEGCVFFSRVDGVETQLDSTEMVANVLDPAKYPEVFRCSHRASKHAYPFAGQGGPTALQETTITA